MNNRQLQSKDRTGKSVRVLAVCLLFGLFYAMPFPLYAQAAAQTAGESERTYVVPGGEVFGVRLKIAGAMIWRVEEDSPAQRAGALPGDVIVRACGKKVEDASGLYAIIMHAEGAGVEFKVLRGGRPTRLNLRRNSKDEALGISVRDLISGIGTVSFYDPDSGAFGGLGHGVCTKNDGQLLPLQEGSVTNVRVTSIQKGAPGRPGQLRGLFYPGQSGVVTVNAACGIFGRMEARFFGETGQREAAPAATPDEIGEGEAQILCAVDGEVRSYEAVIEKILSYEEEGKNFLLHVTDPALIETTGGIVQGMSGSPIMQNGRIVGAVTHVLQADPTRGYGIYIGNMLGQTEKALKRA